MPALRAAAAGVRPAAVPRVDARGRSDDSAAGTADPAGAAVGHAARSGQGRPVTSGFDPGMPNTARVYSRLLGGKDHFPADRAEADLLLEIYPPLAEMVQENRAFIAEAVTWAAGQRIGQFLDLGAGLPAPPAVHQTAQAVLPAAQVAYVDLDPIVLSHARALLAGPVWPR